MKTFFKNLGLFVLIFFVWILIAPISIALPLAIINNYIEVSIQAQRIFLMLGELITIFFIFILYKEEILKELKKFKENILYYIETYFPYWIIMLVIVTVVANIVEIFVKDGPANQNLIEEAIKQTPILIGISVMILAPLTEELIFRLSLRKVFKNDIIYILMSGLIFGFIHIIAGENIINELPYLLTYSIPGFVFAYSYIKSKNIMVPIFLHFLHNTFATVIIFLTGVL